MSTFELDEYGRVKECINCGNTDHPDDPKAIYCIKCGTSLVNECTNIDRIKIGNSNQTAYVCKKRLPPEANYCPYCGSESIFNRIRLAKEFEDLPF